MKMDFYERIMLPEGVRIPFFGGVLYRTLCNIARKKVRKIEISDLSLNKAKRDTTLTFTLTSFPDRIDTVQYTLRTLFMQSMKPDRVVLWLAEDEFDGKELPESIKEFQKIGLEVRFCENMFGHKRYYKLMAEQKENECIVMFDDDILFPKYMVERIYNKWKEFPDCVVCERGQVMTFKDGEVVNPGYWSSISNVGVEEPSYRLLASPGGGCLFPPNALYKDACNTEIINQYAQKTGDIWLMFMAVQNDTKIVRTHKNHRIFIQYEAVQSVQLGREAIYQGRYKKTFGELSKLYPHAYENMLSESENLK
ncbi:MAG: hypothetical protein U0L72_04055 [Acutalibacteraceae bacterium]|nr:hypothetical protein [Acutalibacteraceae bacterium]